MNILKNMTAVLKPGGCVTLQYAFNWRFPQSRILSEEQRYTHCARGPESIGETGGYWASHFLMVHGVKK
jgi:hypothetical protein